MPDTLAVHVLVSPVVQAAFDLAAVYENVLHERDVTTCAWLLLKLDTSPALERLARSVIRGVTFEHHSCNYRLLASTCRTSDAVYLMFSNASTMAPCDTEITVRSYAAPFGTRTVRILASDDNTEIRLRAAAPVPKELAGWSHNAVQAARDCVYEWKFEKRYLTDVPSAETLAWLRDAAFAVTIVGTGPFVISMHQTQQMLMTKLLALESNTVVFITAEFSPTVAWLLQHSAEAVVRILRGDLTDITRTVCIRGYGTIPLALGRDSMGATRDTATGRFEVRLEVPQTHTNEAILRCYFPDAPPQWVFATTTDGTATVLEWAMFACEPSGSPDDADLAQYLPFWRRVTPCILTYLTRFRVVVHAVSSREAAKTAITALLENPHVGFWTVNAHTTLERGLSADEILAALCAA